MQRDILDVGVVLIGRNEGERLVACLASLGNLAARAVYVDSGSTDGSVEAASRAGVTVVELPMDRAFTAARARNAGFEAVMQRFPDLRFVQFVDGDCQIAAGWIEQARTMLISRDDVAIVCGRRRERFPSATVYNRLCDLEWNTQIGEALECGGDCMARRDALSQVGGYAPDLIAGEEPEMCVRLRERGWKIWRIDAEMTLHDAGMTRFGQWWRRSVRAGHAYAEVALRHRHSPKRIWAANIRRAVMWGGALPIAALGASLLHPAFLLLLGLYPLQVARIALRSSRAEGGTAWIQAFFTVLGKFAEMQGIATFHANRLLARRQGLIEYK